MDDDVGVGDDLVEEAAFQNGALDVGDAVDGLPGGGAAVPTIIFLPIGGVASDRLDRRRLMIAADVGRLLAASAMAVLSITGTLEVWHVAVLVAIYGTGQAFFALP